MRGKETRRCLEQRSSVEMKSIKRNQEQAVSTPKEQEEQCLSFQKNLFKRRPNAHRAARAMATQHRKRADTQFDSMGQW